MRPYTPLVDDVRRSSRRGDRRHAQIDERLFQLETALATMTALIAELEAKLVDLDDEVGEHIEDRKGHHG